MKKIISSTIALMAIISFNACTDSNTNQDLNLIDKESNEITMKDFGKTIPLRIDKEDGKFKISFIVYAQPYHVKDRKENASYISMIKQAVENETPIHVFLRANTNKIAKVEKATNEDIHYFKSIFAKEEKTESKKATRIIPNLAILNSLFTQIKNQTCGTSTASTPCITFRYPLDGCYARAHKMRQNPIKRWL